MRAVGDVGAVLAIPLLDDVSARVSDRRVIVDSEMLESVDETALHLPALLSPHCSIDQPLSSSHCVEEELYRVQSIPITVIDEASRCSSHVSRFEEAESSSSVSSQDPLSTNRLLTHVCSHLPNVERGASCARPRHYYATIVHLEVLVCVFSGYVSSSRELVHDVDFQRLFKRLSGKTFQRALSITLNVFIHLLLSLCNRLCDLLLSSRRQLELVHCISESA